MLIEMIFDCLYMERIFGRVSFDHCLPTISFADIPFAEKLCLLFYLVWFLFTRSRTLPCPSSDGAAYYSRV